MVACLTESSTETQLKSAAQLTQAGGLTLPLKGEQALIIYSDNPCLLVNVQNTLTTVCIRICLPNIE